MKNLALKYPIFGSSVDYTKISLTVKGILMGIITLLIAFGIPTDALELPALVDAITTLIVQIGALVSTATILIGGIRKITTYIKEK
jgi:hypothetical protein